MTTLIRLKSIPLSEKYVLIQAIILLLFIKITLRIIQLKAFIPLISRLAQIPPGKVGQPDSIRVGELVDRVGRNLNTTCLHRALAAYVIMRRRRYDARLSIGVLMDQNAQFSAHAWVESQDKIVIGYMNNLSSYTLLPTLWS
jgi:hypothetical protein